VRKITAHEVALAGISTAIATLFLAVGNFTSVLLFVGYMVASVALALPLAKKSYIGYVLAYVATLLLTVLIIGTAGYFIDLLPFILFFGLHPLLNDLQERLQVKKWLAFLVKCVWFDGAMLLFWWLVVQTTGVSWLDAYAVPIVLVGSTLYFALYDYAFYRLNRQVSALVGRILKK
jgi:hypothetical protein